MHVFGILKTVMTQWPYQKLVSQYLASFHQTEVCLLLGQCFLITVILAILNIIVGVQMTKSCFIHLSDTPAEEDEFQNLLLELHL